MNHPSIRKLAFACGLALAPVSARVAAAADVSPPVIMQWFESSWKTMERRTPDLFMAGYGAIWTPPPGRALYDDQGGGIGYNLYDRFDMGKANDPTLYGTEKQYRSLINQVHKMNGDVYVDYVHHHVGSWDVPGYNGWGGYVPESWQHVQDRSDYPGFELSDPYVGANSFDPNYRNLPGHRDSYPDAPPVNDGNTPQFQYQWRLAHLITIDLTSNRAFVRNPVPGDPNNIRQAPAGWAIATSTLLPSGMPGGSTIVRQANTPTNDNRRFYPDQNLPGITVTDPADGNQAFTIYPFNTSDPMAGDPTSETNRGLMMRYAQWLVNDVGVDGLRIDAARHVPFGQQPDAYNPQDIDMPSLVDRATFRQSRRTNLDGSQRTVFNFQEVFTGDKPFIQQFIRKDINPNTPNVVGGNRDALDFPMWFAMRTNLTNNGFNNNWHDIRNASLDIQDDGLANNGSQAIGFVINHDDGKGHPNDPGDDYIHLDNVAHAWILTRPGNAYVFFNSHEFNRAGNTQFFLKDGRGDALGGQYGSIITKLLEIRNTHGRGNFGEKWIDGDGFSNIYAFEREKSMLVGLNSALGTVTNFDERTMATGFAPGTHLVELTGNADDAAVDPFNQIQNTLTVDGSGTVTMRIPRNQNTNGVEHGRGYVIYGLQKPQGAVSLSNVSQTLASELPGSNASARITPIEVITANSFNVTLNTSAVTLSDGFRDYSADGDRANVRIDGGLNINGNGGVDFTTQGDTRYGFENFVTTNDPGYDANSSLSGNGQYVQTINATTLSEGYHYITARAYRQRSDGGPDIYNDFKKVIYVDRLPPQSQINGISTISGTGQSRRIEVRSVDQTADKVDVFMNLGAALTDAQIIALANSGSLAQQTDVDLFQKDFTNLATGTHVIVTLTREITGNYSIIRATGYGVAGGLGIGFGDMDASGAIGSGDVNSFRTVLESSNQIYSPQAEANTDGLVNLADAFLLGPRLEQVGADAPTLANYNSMINGAYVTSNAYTVNSNHSVHHVTAATTHVLGGNTLTARSIQRGDLIVENGGRVNIHTRASGGTTVYLNSLSLNGAGALDLNDQDLVVNQGSFTTIQGLVLAGFGTSSAITSSTSNGSQILALFDNALVSAGEWNGQTIAATAVVGKYTYFGDMNLDGQVSGDDYTVIDANLSTDPAVGLEWISGDANLDGIVTGDDYTVIDANLGLGAGNPLIAANFNLSAVPEPSCFAFAALSSMLGLRRRRAGNCM